MNVAFGATAPPRPRRLALAVSSIHRRKAELFQLPAVNSKTIWDGGIGSSNAAVHRRRVAKEEIPSRRITVKSGWG